MNNGDFKKSVQRAIEAMSKRKIASSPSSPVIMPGTRLPPKALSPSSMPLKGIRMPKESPSTTLKKKKRPINRGGAGISY